MVSSGASRMREELSVKMPVAKGASIRGSAVLILACVIIGAILRIRGIDSQIPIDDEWHGLDFALTRDLWFLFTHFSRAGANSVPFNLCLRTLLVTVGFSELTIALPSLIAGIALLWIFPRWIRRRFGGEAAVVAAALLAIAPFLIFYSRTARSYSILLLFECLALLGLIQWLHSAKRRHAIAWVGFGALAIWMHLSALAPLLCAFVAAAAYRVGLARRSPTPVVPRAWHVVLAGLSMLALAGALWLPALLHPLPMPGLASGHITWRTFTGLAEIISGSSTWPLQLVFWFSALAGIRLATRIAGEEVLTLVAAVLGGLMVVLLTHPNYGGIAAVFARYIMPMFLLVSLAIGMTVQTTVRMFAANTARYLLMGGALAMITLLYLLGPLPRIHGTTNSFTKHPAFQFSYAVHDPDRARPDPLDEGSAPLIHRSELQPFYANLAREAGNAAVIEYPFILGEDANLLYFPQQIHHRPVLAGYYPSGAQEQDIFGLAAGLRVPAEQEQASRGYIMNAMMVDHVLGRRESDGRVRFRTVVNIMDPEAVKRSGAQYLVLHGNILREFFKSGPERIRSYFTGRIREKLFIRYGAPVFENDLITVLRLPDRL
jgi:hypothetical protein